MVGLVPRDGCGMSANRRRLHAEIDDLRSRVEVAGLLCRVTMQYEPVSDTTLASQQVAIGVLDALGIEWDRERYLAKLAKASA